MEKQYSAQVKCKNCKTDQWLHQIPKGTTIKNYCLDEGLKCSSCDCLLFEEEEKDAKKERRKE